MSAGELALNCAAALVCGLVMAGACMVLGWLASANQERESRE